MYLAVLTSFFACCIVCVRFMLSIISPIPSYTLHRATNTNKAHLLTLQTIFHFILLAEDVNVVAQKERCIAMCQDKVQHYVSDSRKKVCTHMYFLLYGIYDIRRNKHATYHHISFKFKFRPVMGTHQGGLD